MSTVNDNIHLPTITQISSAVPRLNRELRRNI